MCRAVSVAKSIGVCTGGEVLPLEEGLQRLGAPVLVAEKAGQAVAVLGGALHLGQAAGGLPVQAVLPAGTAAGLGAASFRARHGLAFGCYAGAMANGIASEDLVIALGQGGVLAFFGAAGLAPARIGEAIDNVQAALGRIHRFFAEPRKPAQIAILGDARTPFDQVILGHLVSRAPWSGRTANGASCPCPCRRRR